jgi:hypothetical protein
MDKKLRPLPPVDPLLSRADWTIFGCHTTDKTTVEEAEAEYHAGIRENESKFPRFRRQGEEWVRDDRVDPVSAAALAKPFGFMNRQWEALKVSMRPGDELHRFNSPPKRGRAWPVGLGLLWFAIARSLGRIITRMS